MEVQKMIASIAVGLAMMVTPLLCATETTKPDVSITATPAWIYDGLTKHLAINCSFHTGNASDFSDVMSIIVSKSSQFNQNIFNEVAVITVHSNDIVDVKDTSLGAHVTGHMPVVPGDAYLTLEWDQPNASVSGEYNCKAYGMDHSGHPRISQASLEVLGNEINTDMCIAELTALQASQKNLTLRVDALEGQITAMTSLVISASSVYGGHRYLLSVPMERNITRSEGICESLGGYLVEIEDKNEYDFVYNFVIVNQNVSKVALGVTDRGHEGRWTFVHSGRPAFIYSRADTNEGPLANCMEIWRNADTHGHVYDGMVDEPCFGANHFVTHTQGRFLCEIDW